MDFVQVGIHCSRTVRVLDKHIVPVATTIATTPQAVGYVGLGYLSSKVKGIKVNGIEPSKANVINGTYPLSRKLYMYTNGAPKDAVKIFLDYVVGPEGQKLVDKAGFVAMR